MEGRGVKATDGNGIPVYYCPYFPMGSIYINVTNINPSIYFGGEWKQIKGKFLLGCDDTHEVGSTGGEETHTLTKDEMPQHRHGILNANSNGSTSGYNVTIGNGKGFGGNLTTFDEGKSLAHNNMPPYLAVYIWKRIA